MERREIGLWHSESGYFQIIVEADDPRNNREILSEYPTGTQIVPIKPGDGYVYEDNRWIKLVEHADSIALQREMNSLLTKVAKSKGYDNSMAILSYLGSAVQQWKEEAEAFSGFRDRLMVYTFALIQNNVSITIEEYLNAAPVTPWPTVAGV